MQRNPAGPLIQGLTTLKPQLMQTLSFYCFQSLCWLQVQSAGVRLVTFRHEHKTWNEWKSTSSSQGKCRCARLASTQSVTSRSREFFILFDGIGTNIGTEKVSELVTDIFGLGLETSQAQDFPIGPFQTFCILFSYLSHNFLSEFLCQFGSLYRSRLVPLVPEKVPEPSGRKFGTEKSPGQIFGLVTHCINPTPNQHLCFLFILETFSVPSVWRGRNQ